MNHSTNFILNQNEVKTTVSPGMLALDYLRLVERQTGTKEGCKEGDCGACAVLLGELNGKSVSYMPMTSCLMPVGELQGKHLVTIEGLNMETLSPVQQAIVNDGATQCGFCTPGIVVSIAGLLLDPTKELDQSNMKYALSGHLCRCTGYRSLKDGVRFLQNALNAKTDGSRINSLVSAGIIPEYFRTISARLRKMNTNGQIGKSDDAHISLAGGTDLYVQIGERIPDESVMVLNNRPEMKGIRKRNRQLHIGALTTFEEFADNPEIRKVIPAIKEYMFLNASWQIRNRATLGGNVINASPIGDMTCLLLALDCSLVLESGRKKRSVPLKNFFKGYKKLDKSGDEVLTEIVLPVPLEGALINFEKVSKRKCLDIASVNSAILIRSTGKIIESANISLGGVAPIPLFLTKTQDYLQGMPLTITTILDAMSIVQEEISPISDIRGSAEYKSLLARQLILAHFSSLFPEQISLRQIYEAH